jgi:hypothetical protein
LDPDTVPDSKQIPIQNYRLVIFKINDIIFMHGGITEKVINLIYNKLEIDKTILSIDNFIKEINDLFNDFTSISVENKILFEDNDSVLWDRTFGKEYDNSTYCEKLLEIFALICSYNNKISDKFIIEKCKQNMVFVIGHCPQPFYFSKGKINTSHSKMEKSLNHHIIDGQIIETSFDNELSKSTKQPIIFGITSTCAMIDNNETGQIYKIDIGTSRAFDMQKISDDLAVEFDQIPIKDEKSIETFLVQILKQHYIYRRQGKKKNLKRV